MRRTTSAEFHATTAADLRSHGLTLLLVLLGPALGALGFGAELLSRLVRKLPVLSLASRAGFAAALALGIFQWLFVAVTSNLPDNAFGLAGLADALALVACGDVLRGRASNAPASPGWAGDWRLDAGEILAACLVLLPLSAAGRELARSRAVHEFWFEISYRRAPVSRALAPVAWSAPRDDPRALRVEDVDALVDFLKQERARFFVFPDFAVLYGLVGVRPPQPLVWFHRGLTYPARYDAALDRRVVAELEQASLRYVVVESVTFLGTEKRLRDFPLLRDYIETRFEPVRRFGIFEVRERIR
jgi:hypothetical protein